jgi:2-methylisocitrate lyase-like PEP mutase family enzyme
MSHVRERFRSVLARPTCILAVNIFDPLSARIAPICGVRVADERLCAAAHSRLR